MAEAMKFPGQLVFGLDIGTRSIVGTVGYRTGGKFHVVTQSIREHGGKIPEDISVASFDNTYIAETAMPGLTSVGYDYEAYGSLLVKAAVGRMNGLPVEKLQMVEPVLVVRGSSGLLPK